jgi:hypothetical protein
MNRSNATPRPVQFHPSAMNILISRATASELRARRVFGSMGLHEQAPELHGTGFFIFFMFPPESTAAPAAFGPISMCNLNL